MRIGLIIAIIGMMLRAFGAVMLTPAIVAVIYGRYGEILWFAGSAAVVIAAGHLAYIRNPLAIDDLQRNEAVAVVAMTWMAVAIAGAFPFFFAGMSPIDAFFESMSGFSTTGSTVITDFAAFNEPIYFWRAVTHLVGGMGIIVLFVAVFPKLAVAGRHLFFAESSGISDDKLTPRIQQTARGLAVLYFAYIGIEIILLVLTGMPLFDAICNGFGTLSTGGFSPNGASIGGYNNPAAEWIIIFFMYLGGANFALQAMAFKDGPKVLWRDPEFKVYTGILLAAAALIVMSLAQDPVRGFTLDTVRVALFNVVSMMSCTGFANDDFAHWSDSAKVVLIAVLGIGACAGSTGGGPKVVRIILLTKFIWRELKKSLNPRAVIVIFLGDRVVDKDTSGQRDMERVIPAVLAFCVTYFALLLGGAMIAIIIEGDIIVGATAIAATLANAGPGLGSIGPMGSFAGLHPVTKALCILMMWMGRLEVFTVFILLQPEAWRVHGRLRRESMAATQASGEFRAVRETPSSPALKPVAPAEKKPKRP